MNYHPPIRVEDPFTKARVTSRGTTLIARRVPGRDKFHVDARIKCGSLFDKKPGTSHFLEHWGFLGTENFPDNSLNAYVKKILGGTVSANTDYSYTHYQASASKTHAPQLILVVSDLVCRQAAKAKLFPSQKKLILSEEAFRDFRGYNDLQRILEATLGQQVPRSVVGNADEIRAIDHNDILDYIKDNYFASLLTVFAEGDEDQEKILDLLENSFVLPEGPEKPVPGYRFQPGTKTYRFPKQATQGTIIFENLPIYASDKELLAARIMKDLLFDFNGPVMERVRHRDPLTYAITTCSPDSPGEIRIDGPSFIVFPEDISAAVDGVLGGILSFIDDPDEAAFRMHKAVYLNEQTEFMERRPYFDTDNMMRSVDYFRSVPPREQILEGIASVEFGDVLDMAHRIFSRASIVYEGNIRHGFPDHTYINSALRTIAPARTMKADPSFAAGMTAQTGEHLATAQM